jgi:3-hydroxyisobutyrate dehydrogenase-like beta-hydroxyacid dehydrogenase
MGGSIARRLLDTGHDLVVWNRTAARMKPLTDLGATPSATPAEAAGRAEAVITMVADPQALRDVTEGPDGVAAGAGASTTIIQMSTVGPESVSRLASVLASGTGLLDAPVLGSVSEAEAGSLRVFAGGPPELIERWTPLLSALGTPIQVGPLGAGTAAKLVANSTLLGVLGILGEALALARRLGLSGDVTFEVLAGTPLAAQAERRRTAIETGEYQLRFHLSLARKDADLILDAAASCGADLRLGKAARTWFADADEDGLGERDYSAVLGYIMRSG